MNRSVERRQFGAIGTVPGEILIGRRCTHPDRGRVRCPAAPLVAAGVRRAGHQAREVPHLRLIAGSEGGDGVSFTASYLDRDGCAVGLVAAAHRTDEAGLAAAREVIMTWSAVWRTRRVMIADVRNACVREPAGSASDTRRRRLGPLRDRACGAPAMTSPSPICPHVAQVHAEARRFADRGDHVVVIGNREHPEASALLALAPGRSVVVESEDDVAALHLPADRVSYLVQPGAVIEQAMPVLAGLRRRYPSLRGAHPDHLCYAGSDRTETIRLVTATSDRTILLGDPDGTAMPGPTVEAVHDPTLLRPAWLAGAECIGIVPAGPSSGRLLTRLVDLLSGLGPLSVVRRRVVTGIDSAAEHNMSNSL